MILNLRVDHKIADIQSMENISKDIDDSSTPDFSYKIDGRVLTFSNSRYEYYIKKLNKKEASFIPFTLTSADFTFSFNGSSDQGALGPAI